MIMLTGSSRLSGPEFRRLVARIEVDGISVVSIRNAYSNHMSAKRRIISFALFAVAASVVGVFLPRPDVVFATSTPLSVAVPGLWLSWLKRRPLVFEVRDVWPEAAIQMGWLDRDGLIARASRWLEKVTYDHSAAVVALSPGMEELVLEAGADPERVTVIPNCSDLDLFHPGEKDEELVSRLGLEGRFVVGYAGAIGPSNAVEVVPEAAAALKDLGREDVVFVLAGDGRSLPGIRATVEEKGLSDLVHIVGSLPKHEVPRFLRTADALLTLFADVPILATNSPNKFFDGLASGRPMIVNSPGWTKDIVEREECGLFVPPGDARALAEAVTRLADDPERAQRMGQNARRVAEERFDRDRMAMRLEEVLSRAVRS